MHQDPEPKYGSLELQWKDGGIPGCKLNRIAHSGRRELLMFSIVCETQRVKQIRAVLAGADIKNKNRVQAAVADIKTNIPGREEWYASTPYGLFPSAEGYTVYQHKLGYGLAHAVFVSRAPGFMLVFSEAALWQELNTTRFTTPILREWVPQIDKALRAENRLEDAHVFNCQCGILTATTSKLDEVVVKLLSRGKIDIPQQTLEVEAA
jgi:hypothetical protein